MDNQGNWPPRRRMGDAEQQQQQPQQQQQQQPQQQQQQPNQVLECSSTSESANSGNAPRPAANAQGPNANNDWHINQADRNMILDVLRSFFRMNPIIGVAVGRDGDSFRELDGNEIANANNARLPCQRFPNAAPVQSPCYRHSFNAPIAGNREPGYAHIQGHGNYYNGPIQGDRGMNNPPMERSGDPLHVPFQGNRNINNIPMEGNRDPRDVLNQGHAHFQNNGNFYNGPMQGDRGVNNGPIDGRGNLNNVRRYGQFNYMGIPEMNDMAVDEPRWLAPRMESDRMSGIGNLPYYANLCNAYNYVPSFGTGPSRIPVVRKLPPNNPNLGPERRAPDQQPPRRQSDFQNLPSSIASDHRRRLSRRKSSPMHYRMHSGKGRSPESGRREGNHYLGGMMNPFPFHPMSVPLTVPVFDAPTHRSIIQNTSSFHSPGNQMPSNPLKRPILQNKDPSPAHSPSSGSIIQRNPTMPAPEDLSVSSAQESANAPPSASDNSQPKSAQDEAVPKKVPFISLGRMTLTPVQNSAFINRDVYQFTATGLIKLQDLPAGVSLSNSFGFSSFGDMEQKLGNQDPSLLEMDLLCTPTPNVVSDTQQADMSQNADSSNEPAANISVSENSGSTPEDEGALDAQNPKRRRVSVDSPFSNVSEASEQELESNDLQGLPGQDSLESISNPMQSIQQDIIPTQEETEKVEEINPTPVDPEIDQNCGEPVALSKQDSDHENQATTTEINDEMIIDLPRQEGEFSVPSEKDYSMERKPDVAFTETVESPISENLLEGQRVERDDAMPQESYKTENEEHGAFVEENLRSPESPPSVQSDGNNAYFGPPPEKNSEAEDETQTGTSNSVDENTTNPYDEGNDDCQFILLDKEPEEILLVDLTMEEDSIEEHSVEDDDIKMLI